MFDAEKWDNLLKSMEQGKARMELLKQAYQEADAEGDYWYRMHYREEYLNDAVFYDDAMLLYVVYPEFLQIYNDYNATCGNPDFTYDVMWDYKWVIGNVTQFYQISIRQAELFFEDFKRCYLANGYSFTAYYRNQYEFYYNIDRKKSDQAFLAFKNEKRGVQSDCLACDRHVIVDYYLRMQNEEEAIRESKDLFNGILQCHEIPAVTYGSFMMFYMQKLDFEKAEEYCNKLKRMMSRKKICSELIGKILMFYSTLDESKALDNFKKNYGWYESNRNPYYKYYFAVGASMLWKRLLGKETIRMKVMGDFPIYQENGMYHTDELYQHYLNEAKIIAGKFDERNGTGYFMELLDCALEGQKIKQWV